MQVIQIVLEILNNREKAVLVWIFIILVLYLRKAAFRSSLIGVVKSFFQVGLLKLSTLMLLYSLVMIWGLWRIGLWDGSLGKESIYWIGSAFLMLMNASKAYEEEGFFKKKIRGLLALTVIVEFLVGLRPYGFLVEMVLFPFAVVFILLKVVVDFEAEKYPPARKFIDFVLLSIFVVYLGNSMRYMVSAWKEISWLQMVKEVAFPLILTLLYLPFIYLVALYLLYETTLIRLSFCTSERKLGWRVKLETVKLCGLDLFKLKRFSKEFRIVIGQSEIEVLTALRRFT